MTTIRRGALTAAPFGMAAAVFVAVYLTSRDRLPQRVATHFSLTGKANGFMGQSAVLWSGVGLIAALGLLLTVLTLCAKDSAGSRLTTAIGIGTAVLIGCLLVFAVLANTGAHDPAQVHLPMWPLAVMLLAGVAAGALTWWLLDAGPHSAPAPSTPSLPLAQGEVAAWSRTEVSRALLFTSGALGLAGVLAMGLDTWQPGLLLLVVGLVSAASAAVRVTVDHRGLTVASTILPRPRLALPLGRIVDAGSVQVGALGDFGGWGYRIRPNRRGVVLRSGEGLAVRMATGREYVVTVDDSATAAALLNGLVTRQAKERG
jgi:hypothetical protein